VNKTAVTSLFSGGAFNQINFTAWPLTASSIKPWFFCESTLTKIDQINLETWPPKETLKFEWQGFVIDSRTTGTPFF